MKTKKNNVQISVQIEKDVRDRFQRLYPYTMSRLLSNCIKLCLTDKNLFAKIFFSEV